jgi:hypothetical protein
VPPIVIPALVERIRPIVLGWKGWTVPGSGMVICRRQLPIGKNIGDRLFEEMVRLRALAPEVDAVLEAHAR